MTATEGMAGPVRNGIFVNATLAVTRTTAAAESPRKARRECVGSSARQTESASGKRNLGLGLTHRAIALGRILDQLKIRCGWSVVEGGDKGGPPAINSNSTMPRA